MIIDFHTHTFPEKIAATTIEKLEGMSHTRAYVDGTQTGLLAAMDATGIDLSVILPVATNTRQVAKVNDVSAALNGQEKVLSFGCMHPDLETWEQELERIAALGLKGIKIHPVYQDVDIDDVRYLRILDKCGQLGLIVVTHAGLDVGFPGKVNVKVTYRVLPNNTWTVDYEAQTDKTTVINPTHHTYWNLAGESSGNVLKQKLQIFADQYTKTDAGLIPTENAPVKGTGFDFTELREIGAKADLMKADASLAPMDNWYDHNFVLRGKNGELKIAAVMYDPVSGRKLEIFTTECIGTMIYE